MLLILDFNWNAVAPAANISRSVAGGEKQSRYETINDEATNICSGDEDDEELREISRDQVFTENLDFLLLSENPEVRENSRLGLRDVENPRNPSKDGFYSFERDGDEYFVRKSSLLWMMANKKKLKLTTDRSRRFIASKETNDEDYLYCGGFAIMSRDGADELYQIMGFKFNEGRETFSGVSCPLKFPTTSEGKARGISVLCNNFKVNENVVTSTGYPFKYININNFKNHVKLKRDLKTNQLCIV